MANPQSLSLFIEGLEPVKDRIYAVILFGSFATGSAHAFSDIDVLVVVKTYDEKFHDRIIEIADAAMESVDYNELLAPHVISVEHFNSIRDAHSDFYLTIKNEGKELWKAA